MTDHSASDDRPAAAVDDAAPASGDVALDDRRDGRSGDASDERSPSASRGRRDVIVPMRLYKTITVFSTLIAVLCVVLGFVLLDAATLQVSMLRSLVAGALAAVGVGVPAGVLTGVFAVVGLVVIAFGAGVYVVGTRFRTRGMGKRKEDADEPSDNG